MTDGMSPADNGQQEAAAPEDNGAFGFQAEPKEEKYDTQYIVASMNKDRSRGQIIVVAVLVAAVLGVALWIALTPKAEPVTPKVPAMAAPVTPTTPATDAPAPQADESPAK